VEARAGVVPEPLKACRSSRDRPDRWTASADGRTSTPRCRQTRALRRLPPGCLQVAPAALIASQDPCATVIGTIESSLPFSMAEGGSSASTS
jgi:hypothetical protein